MLTDVHFDALAIANDLRPVLVRLGRGLRKEAEQLGVTSRQAALLALVDVSPGITASELSAAEGVSAPAMTKQVDRLEAAGYVERIRSVDDRRRVGLALTAEGDALLRRIKARRTAWLADRLDRLEPEELRAIDGVLPLLRRLTEA
ncbi:MAG: MarR family transcriptional regulator [Actinobacteria bacterium]|nr:MarR family transcriptional regulator [Actinomycetota bacterium]